MVMRDDLEALAQLLAEDSSRRVFGYCRISSSKQEQGLSLPSQEDAIRKYCEQHKLGEPFIITETSSAGKRMFQLPRIGPATVATSSDEDEDEGEEAGRCRPRLLLLLGHVTAIKKAHLVVWRLDRLARINDEREVIHQLLVRSEVKLHTTDKSEQLWVEQGDPNDPMAALMRQIFGAFSQYEKAVIELRMQTGLRFKAAKGGYTGGRAGFGYRIEGGDLKVIPSEASVVRYIFMLRHHYKMTIRSIAERLGTNMGHTKVHRILSNEGLYRGTYRDRYGTLHNRPDLKILTDNGDFDYREEFQHGQ